MESICVPLPVTDLSSRMLASIGSSIVRDLWVAGFSTLRH